MTETKSKVDKSTALYGQHNTFSFFIWYNDIDVQNIN